MRRLATFIPELIFNFLLLILGLIIVIGSIRLGFASLKQPGAGLFSFFAGSIIFISEIIAILTSIFKESTNGNGSFFTNQAVKTLLAMIVIFSSWIIVMPFLGYILVTFLAAFAFAKVMGLKGWLKPLVLSIGTSLLAYVLFDWFLYLDLPRGLLG